MARIPCLDGLRAASIVLVLFAHARRTLPFYDQIPDALLKMFGNGTLGVMMFFAISGYLITTLLIREREREGRIDLPSFYQRRILRIFPAFYAYLLVVGLLALAGVIDLGLGRWLSAATFTRNYAFLWADDGANPDKWFVGHFWTLSLEEQFYLLWPITLAMIGPLTSRKVAAGALLAIPLLRIASYVFFPATRDGLAFMLHTSADAVAMGCLLALAEKEPRVEKLLSSLKGSHAAVAALFLFAVTPFLRSSFGGAYWMTVGQTLESLCLVLIIAWAIRNADSVGGRVLQNPVIVRVGVLSYSLYLWQQLFLTQHNETWTGLFPINFVMCYIAAELSYRFIEKPFLAMRRRPQTVGA